MVTLNLQQYNDEEISSGSDPVPAGKYVCEVVRCEEKHTSASLPYFNYGLKIVEGEHEGRYAAFDKLFFHNEPTLKRAKFALRRMGFDVDQPELNIEAGDLDGHFVVVTTKEKAKCPSCKWDVKQGETKGILVCQKPDCTWAGKLADAGKASEVAWDGYEEYTGPARQPSGDGTDFDPAKIEAGGETGAEAAKKIDF